MKRHSTNFRLTALSTFTLGCLGISGGHGDRYGAGGGIATIPGTVVAHGGGTDAIGIYGDNTGIDAVILTIV